MELILRQIAYSWEKLFFLPVTYVRRTLFNKDKAKYKRYLLHKWGFWKRELKDTREELILIYAISAGEFINIKTYCRLLKEKYPRYKIAVATSGYDLDFDIAAAKQRFPWVDYLFILPWDTSIAINRILKDLRIRLFICITFLTAHPFFLKKARAAGIPALLVNGLLSKGFENLQNNRAPNFNARRGFLMHYHRYYDLLGVQNEIDRTNFIQSGVAVDKISVTGNMKFDIQDLEMTEEEKKALRAQLGFSREQVILLGGSIHLSEEGLLAQAFLEVKKGIPDLRLLVVPRLREEIAPIEESIKRYSLRYIKKTELIAQQKKGRDYDAVVVDTFGELKRLYAIADYVYMGASSKKGHPDTFGSHNIFEPLLYKKPVFFGPYLYIFREVTDVLEKSYNGLRIAGPEDLARGLLYLHHNPPKIREIEDASARIIDKYKNSVYNNLELACRLLDK